MSIIKVCGLRIPSNILQIDQLDIQWMGFIFYPPSARFVGWDFKIPAEITALPVGVFVNERSETIEKTVASAGLKGIQLHGDETAEQCKALKKENRLLIKAFGISNDFDFEQLNTYEGFIDYFLFDTATSQKGGSGLQFNHDLLGRYQGNIPFIVSGGLGLQDATRLKTFNHPLFAGIDLNSRFEIAAGLKNAEQLKHFIHEYRSKE
jgi:phosphoribosylanthranilate isomerase